MGLLDKLTGTREPEEGVPAAPAAEVRAALLATENPDWPGTVEEQEDGTLVARFRIEEPVWQTLFVRRESRSTWSIKMRLREEDHEVRQVTEKRGIVEEQGVLRVAKSASAFRGQIVGSSKRWTVGEAGLQETWSFQPQDLITPLREVVLAHGWGWKGVAFGRL